MLTLSFIDCVSCMEPPSQGSLKINMDVAIDSVHGTVGIGWVIRDHGGVVGGGGGARSFEGMYSAREGEVIRVREVLSWVKER